MRIVYFPLLFIALFLGVTGCRNNPFASPWRYAPQDNEHVWKPTKKEARVVRRLDPDEIIDIPKPTDEPVLGDLFDIALKNSPDTARAWQAAREAAAAFSASLSPYLPSFTFDGSFEAIKQGYIYQGSFLQNKMLVYGPQVLLQYVVWDSGETKSNAELYYQSLQSLNWSYNETIQKVMRDVAAAYYNHLYAKALLEAYAADLNNAKTSLDAANVKLRSGVFDETEMLQIKTNYLQRKVLYTGQIATVKNTFVMLLQALGIPCNVEFLIGHFPSEPPLSEDFDSEEALVETAKMSRPDYLAQKAVILANEANVKKIKAELMPKIQMSGSGGSQWFSHGFKDDGDYLFRVDLTFPIFTGFYYINQVRKAESELKKSIATLRQKELSVLSDVKMSHNTMLSAKLQLIDTKEYLDAAVIEYTAMFERYKEGIVSVLDLLNSLAFLSDARAKYAEAQREYYMSIIDVSFATGMLSTSCPWNRER